MPRRVAYLMRDDRGGRLNGVRLVSDRSDDQWSGERFDAREAIPASEDAAAWLLTRFESYNTRTLDTLCVDADGGACSWLSLSSTDPGAVLAQIESQGSPDLDDDLYQAVPEFESMTGRFPDLPGELAVEALPASLETGKSSSAGATRVPVLALPDATVRLLLDALDRRGVRVGSVISLWHAAASAWDPSGPLADQGIRARGDRIVATDDPVTAIVLIDPIGDRLIWSWSSKGKLVAAGSMRVRTAVDRDVQRLGLDTVGELERRVVLTDAEIGRLTQDWLSWSAQIGIAPSRVICVGSPSEIGDDGMSPASVGEAIAARWPETSVDLIDEPDAVGATLRRLAMGPDETDETGGSAHTQMVTLTRRPGSTHRSMYRWAGLSLGVVGLGLGWISISLFDRAAGYAKQILAQESTIDEILNTVNPDLANDPFRIRSLESAVAELRSSLTPANMGTPPPPVLETFDTLSLVLGTPGMQLVYLDVNSRIVQMQLNAPDLATAETLTSALRGIDGLSINWATPTYNENRGRETIQTTYSGQWVNPTSGATP